MNNVFVNPHELLQTKVPDYVPNTYPGYITFQRHRPIFTHFTIREMLVDPRVTFGLWLIKGPMLSKARIKVVSDNAEVQQFVVKMINNFWLNGAVQALKAIEWGYSGSEILYKVEEKTGRIIYNGLKDFESPSVKIVTKNGSRVGIIVDNFQTVRMTPGKAVYLGGPKALHHVHWRHLHPYYGRSRLNGAHIPWNEIWSEGGYRDIRRLWFYKNCFEGGTLRHPRGKVKTKEGRIIDYQDLAQEMIEKKRSGAVWALPSDVDQRGNPLWSYEDPRSNTIPAGLFDYGDSLRIEILEAMGVPYEVVEASGNEGFGSSSGREIPETAFYSILQEELNWLIFDFVEQACRPIVQINASLGLLPYDTFEVLTYPLDSAPEEMDYSEEETEPNQKKQQSDNSNSNTSSKTESQSQPDFDTNTQDSNNNTKTQLSVAA